MSPLVLLLAAKICVTLLGISLPFLILSRDRLDRFSGFAGTPLVLYRLYGTALLALIVAYGFGLLEAFDGAVPWAIITMGIVSNVGAAVILVASGMAGSKPWLPAFFGLIAAGLILTAVFPAAAVSSL